MKKDKAIEDPRITEIRKTIDLFKNNNRQYADDAQRRHDAAFFTLGLIEATLGPRP